MTQLLEDVKLCEWTIGPQQRNIHGGYFWPINSSTTQLHPRIQLVDAKEQIRIPFAPGNKFNDGGRKCLDYNLDRQYIIDFSTKWTTGYLNMCGRMSTISSKKTQRRLKS